MFGLECSHIIEMKLRRGQKLKCGYDTVTKGLSLTYVHRQKVEMCKQVKNICILNGKTYTSSFVLLEMTLNQSPIMLRIAAK